MANITYPQALINDVKAVRSKGGKCFVIRPDIDLDGEVTLPVDGRTTQEVLESACRNCNGIGNLGLEIIVGGPYRGRVPPTEAEGAHITYYDGAYYKHKLKFYQCPICNGSGQVYRQPKQQRIGIGVTP